MKVFSQSRQLVYDTETGEILTFKEFEERKELERQRGKES